MERYEREISRDVYDRAMKNHRRITTEDMCDVFSRAEMCGYGIYSTYVTERDGRYIVVFEMGENSD